MTWKIEVFSAFNLSQFTVWQICWMIMLKFYINCRQVSWSGSEQESVKRGLRKRSHPGYFQPRLKLAVSLSMTAAARHTFEEIQTPNSQGQMLNSCGLTAVVCLWDFNMFSLSMTVQPQVSEQEQLGRANISTAVAVALHSSWLAPASMCS